MTLDCSPNISEHVLPFESRTVKISTRTSRGLSKVLYIELFDICWTPVNHKLLKLSITPTPFSRATNTERLLQADPGLEDIVPLPLKQIKCNAYKNMTDKEGSSLQERIWKGDYREILSWERDKLNVMFCASHGKDSQYRLISLLKPLILRTLRILWRILAPNLYFVKTCRDPALKSASDWKRVYSPPSFRVLKEGSSPHQFSITRLFLTFQKLTAVNNCVPGIHQWWWCDFPLTLSQ